MWGWTRRMRELTYRWELFAASNINLKWNAKHMEVNSMCIQVEISPKPSREVGQTWRFLIPLKEHQPEDNKGKIKILKARSTPNPSSGLPNQSSRKEKNCNFLYSSLTLQWYYSFSLIFSILPLSSLKSGSQNWMWYLLMEWPFSWLLGKHLLSFLILCTFLGR